MTCAHLGGDAAGASELRTPRAVSTPGSASTCCFATGRQNTGDKLRSGARVLPRRRGHSAAPPAERRLRREGWCRRKLRQLHPLVLPRHVHSHKVVACRPRLCQIVRPNHATLDTNATWEGMARRA